MGKVGELIKEHRRLNRLTSGELAKRLGVSREFISLIENGKKKLPVRRVNDFATHLNIKPEKLISLVLLEVEESFIKKL